ncbi:hypothetical protein ACEQ8H_007240 [Pleosporales sp. CAS-2024a]
MDSLGPGSAPRRKRQSHKLNYPSCTFCMHAKVQCLPLHRASSDEKCTRCLQKGFNCSAPQRKTLHNMQLEHLGRPLLRLGASDTTSEIEIHDALALLTLQHFLNQAHEELMIIVKRLLPLKDSSQLYTELQTLTEELEYMGTGIRNIRKMLKQCVDMTAQAVLIAMLDISDNAFPSRHFDELTELKAACSYYATQSHPGIATILSMKRLQYPSEKNEAAVEEMIVHRNAFMASLDDVLARCGLDDEVYPGLRLTETQLFTPAILFQIPAVVEAVRNDARRDCLGRPIGHILYDNNVEQEFDYAAYPNDEDILGRSRLHIVCTLDEEEQRSLDLSEVTGDEWFQDGVLGLTPLHVAAIHGHNWLFKTLLDGPANVCQNWLLSEVEMFYDVAPNTSLRYAAELGHFELVGTLLKRLGHLGTRFARWLICEDEEGDTALHLAAHNGHRKVVKKMLPYIDPETMKTLSEGTSPFYAAVTGRHLDIMKLLEPSWKLYSHEAFDQRSPLIEAARQGFFEGLEYMLELRVLDVNSTDGSGSSRVEKTALDYAIEGSHEACINILKEYGGKTWSELATISGLDSPSVFSFSLPR